jgi:hypothetical protein
VPLGSSFTNAEGLIVSCKWLPGPDLIPLSEASAVSADNDTAAIIGQMSVGSAIEDPV